MTKDFVDYIKPLIQGDYQPIMVNGLPRDKSEITKEEALRKAAAVLGLAEKDVTFLSEETNATAAYCFSGGDSTVAITKKGGYLLYLLSGHFAGESKLEYADARKYAVEFLNKNGFLDMTESYYTVSDGICTINYAYRDGEIGRAHV